MEQTLKKCGDDLTRENLMRQAANLQKLRVPLLLPGITVNTSPTDFYPVQSVQLATLQGRDLGAVRRHHVGRKHLIAADRKLKKAAGLRRPFSLGNQRVLRMGSAGLRCSAWRHSAVSMRPSLSRSQRAKLRSAWAMNSTRVTNPSLSPSRRWK